MRIVLTLLENGANPLQRDTQGVTPIMIAQKKGFQRICETLREASCVFYACFFFWSLILTPFFFLKIPAGTCCAAAGVGSCPVAAPAGCGSVRYGCSRRGRRSCCCCRLRRRCGCRGRP
jgi:hypothetical protein